MTRAAEMVQRARSLAPLLAEHAREAERQRRPPDAVIDALADADMFRLMVPRSYGGLELDLDTFTEVGLALAEGDASLAWVALFYIEHNWMLCQFPEPFQRELYADRSFVLAPAMIAAAGTATTEDGGYRLRGRWSWATGISHGEWVLVGGRVERPDDAFDIRFFAMPRAQVKVEDVWFVDGMAGTGSNDVIVEDVWVPQERTVSILDMSAGRAVGAEIHPAPLYRTPMLGILAPTAAIPAIGQARAAVGMFREGLKKRVVPFVGTRQMDRSTAQVRLARAELEASEAELILRAGVERVCVLRDEASPADRARHRALFGLAVERARGVLARIGEAAGASAHFLDHPLQRARRDVETIGAHMIFELDAALELYGRALLGLDPGPGLS